MVNITPIGPRTPAMDAALGQLRDELGARERAQIAASRSPVSGTPTQEVARLHDQWLDSLVEQHRQFSQTPAGAPSVTQGGTPTDRFLGTTGSPAMTQYRQYSQHNNLVMNAVRDERSQQLVVGTNLPQTLVFTPSGMRVTGNEPLPPMSASSTNLRTLAENDQRPPATRAQTPPDQIPLFRNSNDVHLYPASGTRVDLRNLTSSPASMNAAPLPPPPILGALPGPLNIAAMAGQQALAGLEVNRTFQINTPANTTVLIGPQTANVNVRAGTAGPNPQDRMVIEVPPEIARQLRVETTLPDGQPMPNSSVVLTGPNNTRIRLGDLQANNVNAVLRVGGQEIPLMQNGQAAQPAAQLQQTLSAIPEPGQNNIQPPPRPGRSFER